MAFTPVDVPETDVDDRMLSRLLMQFRERPESAPVLRAVLQAFGSEIKALSEAIHDVIKLRTPNDASQAQLDILGRIVGQSRELVDFNEIVYFEPDTLFQGADQAPVWVTNGPLGTTLNANDAFYRQLIDAKVFRNKVKYGSIPEIQEYVRRAFGLEVSIEIIAPMSIKIYYEYTASDNVIAFLERVKSTVNADSIYTLPLPATVSIGALERAPPAVPTVVITGDLALDSGESGDYDASGSTAASGAVIVGFEWDWEYDGVTFVPDVETGDAESHSWTTGGTQTVAVRATDDFGGKGIGTLEIEITLIINKWIEVADQLGSDTQILALAAFNGKVYGGGVTGKLLEWDGVGDWVEVAPQLDNQDIRSLLVYNGKLYAGTGYNSGDGARLYEWNEVDAWVEVAPTVSNQGRVPALAEFNGKLYGGTSFSSGTHGRLLEWNGTVAWAQVAPQLNSQNKIYALAVFNEKLYGSTGTDGRLFEWNDVNAWVEVAPEFDGQANLYSLIVYDGKLYAGTNPGARLLEWNEVDAWVGVAPAFGSVANIQALVVYDGALYGARSGINRGELLRWNDVDAWVQVASQLNSQINIYSLIAFNGTIYGGTAPGGRLFEAGYAP